MTLENLVNDGYVGGSNLSKISKEILCHVHSYISMSAFPPCKLVAFKIIRTSISSIVHMNLNTQ